MGHLCMLFIKLAILESLPSALLRATAVHTPIAWGHINFAEEKLKTALKTEDRDQENFMKNKGILEILWWSSYLCSDGPNDTLMEILPI